LSNQPVEFSILFSKFPILEFLMTSVCYVVIAQVFYMIKKLRINITIPTLSLRVTE